MENQRMSLDKLKSKLKNANVVANVHAVKGGVLASCHSVDTTYTNSSCGKSSGGL